MSANPHHQLVVVGGGFGGLYAVRGLAGFVRTAEQKSLPGLVRQGYYVSKMIERRLKNQVTPAFYYRNKRPDILRRSSSAATRTGRLHLSAFPAWLVWLLVHIFYPVGFKNKVIVIFQCAWNISPGAAACA